MVRMTVGIDGHLLSRRLFHRRFAKIFGGRSSSRSHIVDTVERVLEGGEIWELGNGVQRQRGAVMSRCFVRGRGSGGWLPAALDLEREWVVEVKQIGL